MAHLVSRRIPARPASFGQSHLAHGMRGLGQVVRNAGGTPLVYDGPTYSVSSMVKGLAVKAWDNASTMFEADKPWYVIAKSLKGAHFALDPNSSFDKVFDAVATGKGINVTADKRWADFSRLAMKYLSNTTSMPSELNNAAAFMGYRIYLKGKAPKGSTIITPTAAEIRTAVVVQAATATNPTAEQAQLIRVDPQAGLILAIRTTRGIVEILRNELATLIDTTVKVQIRDPALLMRTDTGVWRMMAYAGDCTNENLATIGVRHDLYLRAQIALSQLMDVSKSPMGWAWLNLGPKDALRDEAAKVSADWLSCVYGWVSMAMFAGNVQPAMLFPGPTGKQGTGAYLPGKKDLPDKVLSALNEILGLGGDKATEWISGKELYGPMWMGFYDTEEASGWLEGSFAPQRDKLQRELMESKEVRDVDYAYPSTWDNYVPESIQKDPEHKGEKRTTKAKDDPWYLWYYNVLASPDGQNVVTEWTKNLDGVRNQEYSVYTVGPGGSFRLAIAWAQTVVQNSAFDLFGSSFEWYVNNHIEYWKALGVLDYSVGEIGKASAANAKAIVEAKGQIATQAIQAVGGAMMAVPNPIVQGVGAACALIGSLITMGVVKRRKRKAAASAKKPQPLTLRTMTNVECATFSRATGLNAQVEEAARELVNGDTLSQQVASVTATTPVPPSVTVTSLPETAAPVGTSTTPPVNSAPGATEAPPPASPAAVTAGAVAAVDVPIAPLPVSTAVSASAPTWVWIGGGVLGLALLLSLKR